MLYLLTEKRPITFFFLLSLAFIPHQAISQGDPLKPRIKTFPPSSYQAHPQVYCAEQDPTGAMWFGTADLILYYNGEAWEKVPTRSGMSAYSMELDNAGRVWIGGNSEFGYLRPIHPSNNSVPHLKNQDSSMKAAKGSRSRPPGSLEYISLTHLLPDSLRDFNIVWKIHALGEKVYFDAENLLFVLHKGSIKTIYPKNIFYRTHEVNGELWVQDRGHGLYRIPKKPEASRKDPNAQLQKLPGSKDLAKKTVMKILDSVPGILNENRNEVLVLTRKEGLYRYRYDPNIKEGAKRMIPVGKAWSTFHRKAEIYHATAIDPKKNPWEAPLVLSTIRKGGVLLDSVGRPVHVLNEDEGMSSRSIWRSTQGAPGSGIIWSATNQGITRWIPGDPRTFSQKGEDLPSRIMDITTYKGRSFLATNNGIYLRKKGKTGSQWERIPNTGVQCLNILPIGMKGAGKKSLLVCGGGNTFELYPSKKSKRNRGSKWEVREISKKGGLHLSALPSFQERQWFTFGGREGIAVHSRKEGRKWREEIWIRELPEEVNSLTSSSTGQEGGILLWTGLPSQGAFRLQLDHTLLSRALRSDSSLTMTYREILKGKKKGISLTPFVGKGKERKGLPEDEINFFQLQDRIVAGSDAGLYRLDKKDRAEPRWIPDTGLGCLFGNCPGKRSSKAKEVFRLKEGPEDDIWISSGSGTYHLFPTGNGSYRIDSLPFKGMDLGGVRCFFPDKNNVTWMGGDNGLLRYDGKVEKDFERAYQCLIRKVSASLQDPSREKKDSVLFGGSYVKPAPNAPNLDWKRVHEQPVSFVPELPYGMNGLRFRFAAPFHEGQEKVSYSYFLKGFDESWSEWKKETRKEYTSLPEGRYTFKVKAKNIYGVESKMGEYRFRIHPPWYRTWTAYGGYTVAGIGFIWFLLWLNGRRLIAQKQRLEKTVEERTQEIREQKELVEEQKQEVEKKNEVITQQKEEVEEAHREITASIDYAQKIQSVLLQSEDHASEQLPDHFILFKPQATVSGDFYWIKERNGHLYFAAIDCTGHGVPGAFMSMLGISQLNEIMTSKEMPSPGGILTELRERVVAELSSGDHGEGAKDGMDAALIRIPLNDEGKKEIAFAGAQNPLYIVRKGIGEDLPSVGGLAGNDTDRSLQDRLKPFKKSSDGIEIKGDPMPVGYDEYASGDFTTVSFEAQKGDMLYIFSDGYADQFGGEKGKKFRYGPFKELLARIHTMTPEDQKKELNRIFEEWKQDQEQVDDVCVVGIRV